MLQHLIVIVELNTENIPHEAIIGRWVPGQPTEFSWHVDPKFLAGVCPYRPSAGQAQSLINATLQLAGILQTEKPHPDG